MEAIAAMGGSAAAELTAGVTVYEPFASLLRDSLTTERNAVRDSLR
jgi:hypothetical protein